MIRHGLHVCYSARMHKCPQRLVTPMFLSLIGSARIALNEYSAESHTMMISVIDDDGLTYNRTIQFRGATQPGTFGYVVNTLATVFHADTRIVYKGPLLQSEYLGLHISLESVWHVPIWCIACGTHNQKTLHACCSWWTCTCMQVLQGCYSQSSACHALLYIPCEFNYSVDCPRVHSSTLKLYIEWRPHTHTITNL